MNKAKRAEGHSSKVLGALLKTISPQEQARTEYRMLLAAKIDDGRKTKGWTQNEFAEKMGKQPSEISKWLSGTHNFTSDILFDIGELLEIELLALKEKELKVVKVVEYKGVASSPAKSYHVGLNDSPVGKLLYTELSLA